MSNLGKAMSEIDKEMLEFHKKTSENMCKILKELVVSIPEGSTRDSLVCTLIDFDLMNKRLDELKGEIDEI